MLCKICGDKLEVSRAVSCTECLTPFHSDCWEYAEICSVYGCGGNQGPDYVDCTRLIDSCDRIEGSSDVSEDEKAGNWNNPLGHLGFSWNCTAVSVMGWWFVSVAMAVYGIIAYNDVFSFRGFVNGAYIVTGLGLIYGQCVTVSAEYVKNKVALKATVVTAILFLIANMADVKNPWGLLSLHFIATFMSVHLSYLADFGKGQFRTIFRLIFVALVLLCINFSMFVLIGMPTRGLINVAALSSAIGLFAFWFPIEVTYDMFINEKSKLSKVTHKDGRKNIVVEKFRMPELHNNC